MSSPVPNVGDDAPTDTTAHTDGHSEQQPGAATGRDAYNYRRFRFWPARDGIHRDIPAGTPATDETLYTLDGEAVQLSDLWKDQPVVIEFSSITCPIFAVKVDTMDELARTYAEQVDFYVVYTREAHPGANYHRHTSFEQKLRHAMDTRAYEAIERPILVDDVNETMHRAYDSLPNSVHIIGRDGIVAHRADWITPDRVNDRLDVLLEHDGRGAEVTPTNIEENYHQPTLALLKTILRVNTRAGPGSLRDFMRAAPRMIQHRAWQWLTARR